MRQPFIYPGPGFGAPARPEAGASAEVQLTGTRKHGHGTFGPTLTKKTVAYVIIRTPERTITRTITGDYRIRMMIEWCDEFNRRSDAAVNRRPDAAVPPGRSLLWRSPDEVRAAGSGIWAAGRYPEYGESWQRRYLAAHPEVAARLFPDGIPEQRS